MKRLFLIAAMTLACAEPLLAADAPCARINPAIKDADGVPLCPSVVTETSAFGIFRCAMKSKSWHPPTPGEISGIKQMLQGVKEGNMAKVMKHADSIGLQACRTKDGDDSYLILMTKYGVSNYNGPFFMLRDPAKSSRVAIIAPHSGTDGYHSAAPLGFQKTKAFALIQNGHKKGIAGRASDFSHTKDTLGWHAVKEFGQLWPNRLVWHIHGMKAPDHVLYRPLTKSPFAKTFEAAVTKHTGIKTFKGFNAHYWIDPGVSTSSGNNYIKCELPVRLYGNHKGLIVAKIVKEFEAQDFAWDAKPQPSPEPEVELPQDGEDTDPGDEAEGDEHSSEENPPVTEDDDINEAEVSTPTPSATVPEWKPAQRIKNGTKTLTCYSVKFANDKIGAPAATCQNIATAMSKWYKRASRGKLVLVPKTVEMTVPYNAVWTRTEQSKLATDIKKKPASDYRIVPLLYKSNGNHGGGGWAWVVQGTTWVVAHEIGHGLGLGHSGKYDEKRNYANYGDNGASVMANAVGSQYIAPNQMYHLGFLNPDEFTTYDGKPVNEYTFGLHDNYFAGTGLAAVAIHPQYLSPGGKGRIGWIGARPRCGGCIGFYLSDGGSSALVKVLGALGSSWVHPESGMKIEIIEKTAQTTKIRVTK